jgi:hypothetical protein
MSLVRYRTIPIERPPLVGEVSASFLKRVVCRIVSVADHYRRNLGFLDRCCYFFFQVASQLYSRGWVDPVPDPLFLRKSGSAGNRTRNSGSVARKSDHFNIESYCHNIFVLKADKIVYTLLLWRWSKIFCSVTCTHESLLLQGSMYRQPCMSIRHIKCYNL